MRQHSRVVFRTASRVPTFDRSSGELLGKAADLSMGGMRLVSDQELVVGQRYDVLLEITLRGARTRIHEVPLVLTCLWSQRNARLGRYEQGMQVLEKPQADFALLLESLQQTEDRARKRPS